jgi:transcriptional regulator with XRE-family HTH domain
MFPLSVRTLGLQDCGELGRAVRAARIAAGLTQADAAGLCGVSAPFLNGLERGKENARLGLVLRVCRGLGIGLQVTLHSDVTSLAEAPKRKPRSDRRRVPLTDGKGGPG